LVRQINLDSAKN